MKKILFNILIIVIIIFISFFVWFKISPLTFYKFFVSYPRLSLFITRSNVIDEVSNISSVIISEPVSSQNGQIIIKNNTWNVEIVSEEADLAKGLSNRKTLYNNKGMLFAFDQMATQSFWMKDMLIPIDMIFFDEGWKIVLIESNIQPNTFPKVFGSSVKSQYILEINSSEANTYGLKVGDQAVFLNK